jgi:hypothetical protein
MSLHFVWGDFLVQYLPQFSTNESSTLAYSFDLELTQMHCSKSVDHLLISLARQYSNQTECSSYHEGRTVVSKEGEGWG